MLDCQQIINFYFDKYIVKHGKHVCAGPDVIPATFVEFYTSSENISDNWDSQIACVLTGYKKVAITDYTQFDPHLDEDLKAYYETIPKDTELRDNALKCGVQRFQDNTGTEYWFYPKYKRNVEILMNHYQRLDIFPSHLFDIIQGLLLGYNDISIVLYALFNAMVWIVGKMVNDKIPPVYSEIDKAYVSVPISIDLIPESIPILEASYSDKIPIYINRYEPLIKEAKEWIIQRGGIV